MARSKFFAVVAPAPEEIVAGKHAPRAACVRTPVRIRNPSDAESESPLLPGESPAPPVELSLALGARAVPLKDFRCAVQFKRALIEDPSLGLLTQGREAASGEWVGYVAPVNTVRIPIAMQQLLLSLLPHGDPLARTAVAGQFSTTFPGLARLRESDESLADLQFEALRPRILVDRDRKIRSQAVTMLGAEISVDVIFRFGIVLLAILQFYLLVHLGALARRIGPNDKAWTIPWMGLYRQKLPRVASALMVGAVAPTVALVLWIDLPRDLPRENLTLTALAAVCIGAALSLRALLRIWRVRDSS